MGRCRLVWTVKYCGVDDTLVGVKLALKLEELPVAEVAHCSLVDVSVNYILLLEVQSSDNDRKEDHGGCHEWRYDYFPVEDLGIDLLGVPNSEGPTGPCCHGAKEDFLWFGRLVVIFLRDEQCRINPHHLSEVLVALLFSEGKLDDSELVVFET